MVAEIWREVLRRLECEPPVLAGSELGNFLGRFLALGLIQAAEPLRVLPCPECDGSRLLSVGFSQNDDAQERRAYVACPECGISKVHDATLKRWQIDPVTVARASLRSLLPTCNPVEIVPQLWRMGRVRLAGQPREVYFSTANRPSDARSVVEILRTRPASILLLPSEAGAARSSQGTENLVLALESLTWPSESGIEFDLSLFETRVATHFEMKTSRTIPKRRSSRLADIDALKVELIQHLRAARDHAGRMADAGVRTLLPRPSKEELGRRAGVPPHRVSRCFSDPAGHELRWMWELAIDVDRILEFGGEAMRAS